MSPSKAIPLSFFSRAVLWRFMLLSAVAAGMLSIVVLVLYFQERSHERSLLQQQGRQRIDQEFAFLTGEIDAIRSDVLYLAEQDILQRLLAGDELARQELTHDYVSFAERRAVYDQIRFIDTAGNELVRVNYREGKAKVVPDEELQLKSDRYYYREALAFDAGEVFVSEFDLNVEHGQIQQPLNPVLRFLTPVVDSAGTTRGLIALNFSGNYLLRRFSEVSLPGSTLLINTEGQYIYGLQAGDAWGWLLAHDRSFSKQFPKAWDYMQGKSEGQFSTAEGLFAFRLALLSQSSRVSTASTKDAVLGNSNPAPLVIVAYLPPELLYLQSTKLLKQLLLMYAGAMALLTTLGWYWAHSAAVRTQQARSIAESEGRLRTLSNQLLTAQEVERRSICRELHDDLGQQLTAIYLDLQLAAKQQDASRSQSLLTLAVEETEQLVKSLHDIASRVRPSVLDDLGLQEAIATVASEIQRRANISVETVLDIDETRISTQIGENAYRIVQEALLNVARHANTNQASVEVITDVNDLRVTVEDHGKGFELSQLDGSRLGVLSMRERAELLGGSFSLTSKPGLGTCVSVRVPLSNDRA